MSTPDADGGTDSELAELAQRCLSTYIDDVTSDSLVAAQAAYAAGDSSIALSPQGCTRLFVHRTNGQVTDERLLRPPYKFVRTDLTTFQPIFSAASDTRFVYRADGEDVLVDGDGDGFAEVRTAITYGVKAVREQFEKGSNQVVARTTVTTLPSGSWLHLVEEELGDSGLETTRTLDFPELQLKCNKPVDKPPPRDPSQPPTEEGQVEEGERGCTAGESMMINKAIATAVQRGSGCLHAVGKQSESEQVIRTVVHNAIKATCVDNPAAEWIAGFSRGYMQLHPGEARIVVNVTPGRMGTFEKRTADYQAETLAHELYHSFAVHEPDLEAAANPDQLALTDQVYACEYLCFGDMPTQCHLAACQGKKLSTTWKGKSCKGTLDPADGAKLTRARGDGVSVGPCNEGQQIGAVCHRHNFDTEVMFCTTEMECNEMCQEACESKSLSCLAECR